MFTRCRLCGHKYHVPSHRCGGKAANTCLVCHKVTLLMRVHTLADNARIVWNATVGTPLYRAAMNRIWCQRYRLMRAISRAYRSHIASHLMQIHFDNILKVTNNV